MRFTVLLLLFLLLISVAQGSDAVPMHVGRYTSNSWGFDTNSYWIEGPTGLVLIDTQFLLSAAKEAVEVAERYTGKRVVLAVVLHANPDKFNGTGYLQARGIRVITSQQVKDLIPEVDKVRRGWFYERYRPDYPEQIALPDAFGGKTTKLSAAGLQLNLHVFGPATSRAHVAVQAGEHLFVGDLVANHHHSWLELGLVNEWLGVLKELRALHPRYVYPGRGYPADITLLDDQAKYLRTVREIVNSHQPRGELSDELHDQISTEITQQFPNYGNEFFVNRAVSVLWERLIK